ncbi:hypothetical protein B0H19DRAFT_1157720 [Mycena capillaripes]|nr:hypothetical protein B0H19DRAFT_1157720 [Mycena capillaripes]
MQVDTNFQGGKGKRKHEDAGSCDEEQQRLERVTLEQSPFVHRESTRGGKKTPTSKRNPPERKSAGNPKVSQDKTLPSLASDDPRGSSRRSAKAQTPEWKCLEPGCTKKITSGRQSDIRRHGLTHTNITVKCSDCGESIKSGRMDSLHRHRKSACKKKGKNENAEGDNQDRKEEGGDDDLYRG